MRRRSPHEHFRVYSEDEFFELDSDRSQKPDCAPPVAARMARAAGAAVLVATVGAVALLVVLDVRPRSHRAGLADAGAAAAIDVDAGPVQSGRLGSRAARAIAGASGPAHLPARSRGTDRRRRGPRPASNRRAVRGAPERLDVAAGAPRPVASAAAVAVAAVPGVGVARVSERVGEFGFER